MDASWLKLIPWLPAASAIICAIAATNRKLHSLAAVATIVAIAGGFFIALAVHGQFVPEAKESHSQDAAAHVEHEEKPIADAEHEKAEQPADEKAHEKQGQAEGKHAKPKSAAQTLRVFEWINLGYVDHNFATEADAQAFAHSKTDKGKTAEIVGQNDTGKWVVRTPRFEANFNYYIDSLTIVMLFVVCGIGALVAIYAAGYMQGDRGYARFFAGVSIFIFAMTHLIMADNLILIYLGWEGVGLASYLLIGFYYQKPEAVAAAKKAFIVNRIGDLGFALGIFLTYVNYDTVIVSEIIKQAAAHTGDPSWMDTLIPFLLMLGAFGKSAQIPLYVWLPDAMEGPTPVSALIHAATMVTSGVYLIARLHPVFELSEYALLTVSTIGVVTATFAATIALCQYDLKKIYAYSTISQLGYMFLGVGMDVKYAVFGAVFHLVTHAFFKALLFLTSGNVMHGMAGQLDLRKMSGMRKLMPYTCWLMFVGCLALAAFPFTAGFYSKDSILAGVFEKAIDQGDNYLLFLGILAFATAFLTAFYTFRLWFRVFMGPTQYEMGEEHHGDEDHAHDHDSHADDDIHVEHHHEPHEAGWLMLAPLFVLAIGAAFAGYFGYDWMKNMVVGSTAGAGYLLDYHGKQLGNFGTAEDLHLMMQIVSAIIAFAGIGIAAYFHWFNRPAADAIATKAKGLVKLLNNKYYIDEINDALIVKPLNLIGQIFFVIDSLIVHGLVVLVGFVPRAFGETIRPAQYGSLQGYGLSMLVGLVVIIVLIVSAMAGGSL